MGDPVTKAVLGLRTLRSHHSEAVSAEWGSQVLVVLPMMQAPPSFLLLVFSQEAERKVRPRRDLVKMSISDAATSGHLSWRFGVDWKMSFLLTVLSFTRGRGMCVSGGVWAQNSPSFSLLLSFDLRLQLCGAQPILRPYHPIPQAEVFLPPSSSIRQSQKGYLQHQLPMACPE